MINPTTPEPYRPNIYATDLDLARLRVFAHSAMRYTPGVALLRQEIARMSPAAQPDGRPFVRLGSSVIYRDLRTTRHHTVRVVGPSEVDLANNRVSVLSSIGAALVGLPLGAVFRWSGAKGAPRAIKLLAIDR